MDWTAFGASVATALMGIGAVWAFASQVLPKAVKYVGIAKDALELAGDAINAISDKTITAEEIAEIKADYARLLADFKA